MTFGSTGLRYLAIGRAHFGLCCCLIILWSVIAGSSRAEYWVNYYETGSCKTGGCKVSSWTGGGWHRDIAPNIVWDTQYYVDMDSIRRDGKLLIYRTKVYHLDDNRTEFYDMIVDCAAKTRGQLPSREMYLTFPNTIGGDELKTMCELAAQAGK